MKVKKYINKITKHNCLQYKAVFPKLFYKALVQKKKNDCSFLKYFFKITLSPFFDNSKNVNLKH